MYYNRTVCLEHNFKFFSVRWQKAVLSNRPQLITPIGGEEKMQADATPNKLFTFKKQAAHVLAFCATAYTQHTGVCILCTLAR